MLTSASQSRSRKFRDESLASDVPCDVYNNYSFGALDTETLHAETPLVSVIIPAFNPGEYLAVAIRSVVEQTYGNWEIVVLDDGSTEDLSFVCSLDVRVRWIRQENQGVSTARNAAVAAALGKYVAFLDADDAWLPDKLRLQLAMFERQPALGFCHTQFEMMDESGARGNPLLGVGFAEKGTSYEQLLRGCSVCISSVMMRRDVLQNIGVFDVTYESSEDYDLWLRVADGNEIGLVPSIQTQYRKHISNMSSNYWVLHNASSHILQNHREKVRRNGNRAALRAVMCGQHAVDLTYGSQAFDQLRLAMRRRDAKAVLRHGAYAFRYAPSYSLQSLLRYFLRG